MKVSKIALAISSPEVLYFKENETFKICVSHYLGEVFLFFKYLTCEAPQSTLEAMCNICRMMILSFCLGGFLHVFMVTGPFFFTFSFY